MSRRSCRVRSDIIRRPTIVVTVKTVVVPAKAAAGRVVVAVEAAVAVVAEVGAIGDSLSENTWWRVLGVFLGGNYLRVRGEYVSHSRRSCAALELPPRTRRIQVGGGVTEI